MSDLRDEQKGGGRTRTVGQQLGPMVGGGVINVGSKYRDVAEEELRALLTLRSSPSCSVVSDQTLHRPFLAYVFFSAQSLAGVLRSIY